MKIGEFLYFSPKYRFEDLRLEDTSLMIKAFADRINGFYLHPAEQLISENHSFAGGLICVCAIDAISRFATGGGKSGVRFKEWLTESIRKFDQEFAHRFYKDFRCGLVHEGRIDKGGQFSLELGKLVDTAGDIMIVNPKLLLEEVKEAFECYLVRLKENKGEFESFMRIFKKDFKKELNY